MAEFVQQSIEEMLPELEQMQRVGLFSCGETRAILKKRTSYEYKLRRRTRCKEDYLQYIQYEINVLALVKKRRQRTGHNYKKLEIDIAIVQRVHQLFKLACVRFKEDVKLWLSHIEFCKSMGERVSVGRLFTKMLQIHSRQPGLWVLAAKWELEDNMFMDNARSLLQRGLRFNKSSKQLWLEYFRMELLNCEKMLQRKKVLGMSSIKMGTEEVTDAVLQGRVALVVFKNAIASFPDDVEFSISFLPVCRLFHMDHIEEAILHDTRYLLGDNQAGGHFVQECHPASELTWDAIARTHLYRATLIQNNTDADAVEKDKAMQQAVARCWDVYEEAVLQLNTEKMWTLYMKTCLQLAQSTDEVSYECAAKCDEVFHNAFKAGCLSEAVMCDWLGVLRTRGEVEERERVSEMGVVRFPRTPAVWTYRLDLLIQTNADLSTLMQCLDKALTTVRESEWLPLWNIVFRWCLLNAPEDVATEALLERGVQAGAAVCGPAKEAYLQWAVQQRDITFTRRLYKRLSSTKPVTIGFYRMYLEIEQAQTPTRMKRMRRVYEDALSEYGSCDTDLWLDYIRLEMNDKNGSPEKAGNLHWRALKALADELVQTFVSEYTLMQTGQL